MMAFVMISVIVCKFSFPSSPLWPSLLPNIAFKVFVSTSKGLIMLRASAELGTTPNIKHIAVGRCYDYVTLVNPGLR